MGNAQGKSQVLPERRKKVLDINKSRRLLMSQMVLNGQKKHDLAKELGLTKATISKRFKDFDWTTLEARKLVILLGLDYKTASSIFFGDDVASKETT